MTCAELDVAALSSFAYPWSAIVDTSVADTLKNSPVGTGPYKLKEWVPQQSLTLEKNPDYYDTVNLETITFKMMPGRHLADRFAAQRRAGYHLGLGRSGRRV